MDLHRTVMLRAQYRIRAELCRLRGLRARDAGDLRRLRQKELWYRGIPGELQWWRDWLPTEEGRAWQADVLDPERRIQDHVVAELIATLPGNVISILEVGAGPITHLGYTYPGRTIRITPVDPLAGEYAAMLRRAGVTAPVRSVKGDGEALLRQFKRDSFDLAWASNALDHCYDPILVIRNLLAVVKVGHPVVLRHYRNEGHAAEYEGMHQWNFDVRDNDLIVWANEVEHNVTKLLRGEARIDCMLEDSRRFGAFEHNEWVVCVLTRL
jgi:SAM-dependent methyltransferase